MLPEPKHLPATLCQRLRGFSITLTISSDLLRPVVGVRLRHDEVVRTAVPIAAVNEYCDVLSTKDDVGPASDRGFRPDIDAVSQSLRMQNPSHCEFRLRIATSVGAHRVARGQTRRP